MQKTRSAVFLNRARLRKERSIIHKVPYVILGTDMCKNVTIGVKVITCIIVITIELSRSNFVTVCL